MTINAILGSIIYGTISNLLATYIVRVIDKMAQK